MSEEGLSSLYRWISTHLYLLTKVFSSSREKSCFFVHILLDHVASSDTDSHVFPFSLFVHSFPHPGHCQLFVTAINMTPTSLSLPYLFWLPQTVLGCGVLTLQLCLGEFNLFMRFFGTLFWLPCILIFPLLTHIHPASGLCEMSSSSPSAHPKFNPANTLCPGPHAPVTQTLCFYTPIIGAQLPPVNFSRCSSFPTAKVCLAQSFSIQITRTPSSHCQNCVTYFQFLQSITNILAC